MIYDYKSKETVQDVVTECLCPIVDDIVDEYHKLHRYEWVCVYAPSHIGEELVVRLLNEIDDAFLDEEIDDDELVLLSEDNEDVIITLAYDGSIFVESARFKNGKLKHDDGELIYVYDTFSKRDVEYLSEHDNAVLVFGLEDEEFEDEFSCYDCDGYYDEDEDEFDISSDDECEKDVWKITVKCDLDADEALNTIKELERRMLHINEIFDEMNNFRKLFNW